MPPRVTRPLTVSRSEAPPAPPVSRVKVPLAPSVKSPVIVAEPKPIPATPRPPLLTRLPVSDAELANSSAAPEAIIACAEAKLPLSIVMPALKLVLLSPVWLPLSVLPPAAKVRVSKPEIESASPPLAAMFRPAVLIVRVSSPAPPVRPMNISVARLRVSSPSPRSTSPPALLPAARVTLSSPVKVRISPVTLPMTITTSLGVGGVSLSITSVSIALIPAPPDTVAPAATVMLAPLCETV